MFDLGDISYFLGIKFYKTNRGLMMCQRRYAGEILKRFKMEECNSTSHLQNQDYNCRKTQKKMMSTQPNIEDLLGP